MEYMLYVEFDSHCYYSIIDPSDALTYTTTGTVEIDDIQWYDGDYKIMFTYSGTYPYTVNMTVNSDYIWGIEGYQNLDGGNSTTNGVTPNGDDYDFSFSF